MTSPQPVGDVIIIENDNKGFAATPKYTRKLIALLTKPKHYWTHDQYTHLYPTSDMIPRLYSKNTHRQNTP